MLRRPATSTVIYGLLLGLIAVLLGCGENQKRGSSSASNDSVAVEKDVPYVSTPQRVVERMLQMADVSADDVVYDLGSGDGRFVITAAQQFGARAVGIEIDPRLIEEARAQARFAGVTNQVEFRRQNLFETNLTDATVVTLYLEPELNIRLRPKLFRQLAPGSRVVSHDFDMGAWTPDRKATVGNSTVYLWTIPKQVPESLTEP